MYKEVIISIVVIITILTVNWLLQDYTKNRVRELNDNLELDKKVGYISISLFSSVVNEQF